MKKYVCYEEPTEGIYTLSGVKKLWNKIVTDDIKESYENDFEAWLHDMLRYDILREIEV